MAFVLDLLRQAGDVLITAELAVVVGAAGFLVHMAGRWNLARAFGRGPLFTLGMILFPPLFTLILGLGGAEYRGTWVQGR